MGDDNNNKKATIKELMIWGRGFNLSFFAANKIRVNKKIITKYPNDKNTISFKGKFDKKYLGFIFL